MGLGDRHVRVARLAELLRSRFEAARARSGDFGFALDEFASHMDSVLEKRCEKTGAARTPEERERLAGTLQIEDLYMAYAMSQGHPHAWELFTPAFLAFARHAARQLTRADDIADEVCDNLLGDLFFVDARQSRSRLLSYTGAASLNRWLWMVLRNRVIDVARSRAQTACQVQSLEESRFEHASSSGAEESVVARESRALLADAFQQAMRSLKPREALMLRMRYSDGCQQREIAATLGASEYQISRWLSRSRRLVQRRTMDGLRRGGMGKTEAEELLREVLDGYWPADSAGMLEGDSEAGDP